jgi:hypothetical protein
VAEACALTGALFGAHSELSSVGRAGAEVGQGALAVKAVVLPRPYVRQAKGRVKEADPYTCRSALSRDCCHAAATGRVWLRHTTSNNDTTTYLTAAVAGVATTRTAVQCTDTHRHRSATARCASRRTRGAPPVHTSEDGVTQLRHTHRTVRCVGLPARAWCDRGARTHRYPLAFIQTTVDACQHTEALRSLVLPRAPTPTSDRQQRIIGLPHAHHTTTRDQTAATQR